MPMNLLDIVVLLLLAGAVLNGLRRGFVLQIASLIGFVLALVIAFRFSADLANGLGEVVPVSASDGETPSWLSFLPLDAVLYRVIAFVLLFFGTKFLFRLIAGMLHHVVKLPVLNTVNRLAGVFLALVQIGIILVIAINVLQFIPGPKMQSLLQESWFATWVTSTTPALTSWLKEWILSPKT